MVISRVIHHLCAGFDNRLAWPRKIMVSKKDWAFTGLRTGHNELIRIGLRVTLGGVAPIPYADSLPGGASLFKGGNPHRACCEFTRNVEEPKIQSNEVWSNGGELRQSKI
jgi:hypothetical protein